VEYAHLASILDRSMQVQHLGAMEYEPQPERIRTDQASRHTGSKVPPEKRAKIEEMLKAGEGIVSTARAVGSSEHTVSAIRNDLTKGVDVNAWKKGHSQNLMAAAQRMGERLLTEIDNISPAQLPLAIAIITDKALALNDQPTTVTEHRLRISHDQLDKIMKGEVVIDVPSDPAPPAG